MATKPAADIGLLERPEQMGCMAAGAVWQMPYAASMQQRMQARQPPDGGHR